MGIVTGDPSERKNRAAVPALVPAPVPGETFRDLPARIRDHARARPDATALIEGDRRISAAELADRMDRTATCLAADGIAPGDVVASLAGVTADHVTLYLAVLAAGAALAPLPLSAHPEALERMVANSGAKRLFAEAGALEVPDAAPIRRDLAELIEAAQDAAPHPPRPMAPDALFDILYSSGTTGAPKGIEHDARFRDRQIARLARFEIGPDAVMLISTPIYSNTTLAALLPALGLGATTVLVRKFAEEAFLATAEAHRATHAMLVPVQIRRLVEHPAFDRFDLASFRVKLSTSAPLPAPLVRDVLARWPGRMVNIYGMTEGGVSAILDCGAHADKLHTVGRAVPGAEIRIIDEAGRELPVGEAGEVVGRSPTIMRGYRGDPEATRAATWVGPEGEAFIRTGDMGRFDEDGFLTLLDRKRDMILSGGFNIFASDLETVLLDHPAVHEAAVIGVADDRWGETPVACVTLAPGEEAPEAESLRVWANERLGRTQRLSRLVVLEALPRNVIGKVLKRTLKAQWDEGRIG